MSPIPSPEVLLFGGSFDPPHNGHKQCVQVLLDNFPSCEVWVVPAVKAPISAANAKVTQVPFAERKHLCEILFSGLPRTRVSDLEEDLPTPSYSINSLRAAKKLVGEKRLALVIGSDQWAAFPKWHEPHAILAIADIIVIKRQGIMKADITQVTAMVTGQLEVYITWDKNENIGKIENFSSYIYILEKAILAVESQNLRKQIASGQRVDETFLEPRLMDYILQKGLYN